MRLAPNTIKDIDMSVDKEELIEEGFDVGLIAHFANIAEASVKGDSKEAKHVRYLLESIQDECEG